MIRPTNKRFATRIVALAERNGAAIRMIARPQRAFPARWSHLFGHMALFSFVLLLMSGVLLALWFEPSMTQVDYDGGYAPLRGVRMSEAYASTLEISFEIRGGLLVRQIHQWASLVFVSALAARLVRMFVNGAFRGWRWLTWLLVLAMLLLGIVEAFLGHLLPDDLLSGTSLRVTEGYLLATPIVGTYVASAVYGGEFPGDVILPRLDLIHSYALPVLIIAVFAGYLMVTRSKQPPLSSPSPARAVVLGYTAKMASFMLLVVGVIVVMAATIQVNPVWLWGPFDPAQASAGSQPPWYLGFLDGAVRLMPPWDLHLFGHELTLSIILPVMVLPGIVMGALALYPWFEQYVTGDRRDPEVLDRPRDMPVRTGLAAAFVAFYVVLLVAGGNDIIASRLNVSLNGATRFLQVAVFMVPPLVFWITKRICLGLQLREHEEVIHGRETGVIIATPEGGFIESHQGLSTTRVKVLTAHPDWTPIDPGPPTDADGIPNPRYGVNRLRAPLSRFYFADVIRVADITDNDETQTEEQR